VGRGQGAGVPRSRTDSRAALPAGAHAGVPVEALLREHAPQVLAALVRRYGHFELAEDAVQEALLVAATRWPVEGVPDKPRAWLIRVGARRLVDRLRSEDARRRREQRLAAQQGTGAVVTPAGDAGSRRDVDDTLLLLVLCCHPALTPPSQIALTLRAVAGLTTAEIATAFLVPEATMAQRISRAKRTVAASDKGFIRPGPEELPERLRAVRHVLYLVFNEGYTASAGSSLQRVELAAEAIRLTRLLQAADPHDGQTAGLLALLLLTDARRAARTGPHGELIPLDEQDRSRWDQELLSEGLELATAALMRPPIGPYQIQAAIAAVHAEARTPADTDWPQILALYGVLEQFDDNPIVTLNRAVAEAMVHGPRAGLACLAPLDDDPRLARHHRLAAVRAHLLEMAGDLGAAREHYRLAARATTSLPERQYLDRRAARLRG
jgi:RNA polymerase sigma factor (sigma-70 family)